MLLCASRPKYITDWTVTINEQEQAVRPFWVYERDIIKRNENKFCFQGQDTRKRVIHSVPCSAVNRTVPEGFDISDGIPPENGEQCYCELADTYCGK